MRHHNCTWHVFRSFTTPLGRTIDIPYDQGNWSYTKPSSKRRYIQVIQYVADHPDCKRAEIYEGVFGRKFTPGSQSALFSNLLYEDFIDYDTCTYRYFVTRSGKDLLKEAYLADMEAIVKAKA